MAKSTVVISHWHHHAEEFNASALEFYSAVREELAMLQAPVTFSNIEWSEGGVLSAKRAYLRVEFNRLVFDICAAPFGKNFFFSWWLARKPVNAALGCLALMVVPIVWGLSIAMAGVIAGSLVAIVVLGATLLAIGQSAQSGASEAAEVLSSIPYIGPVLSHFIRPVTYYSVDTRIMFEETVHETVLRVVDGLLAAKGAKALAPDERNFKSTDPLT